VRSVLFDHIAIAVPRLADAEAVLAGELGGRSTFGMTTDEYRFWHWRFVEYSSRRAVPLSDDPHPVLGAVFKRSPAD